MEYTTPKGLFDIIPLSSDPESAWKLSHKWQYLESIIRDTCNLYGFQEIRTPIFEKTDLFIRSSGESSDIVSKEMYTFEDKAGRQMSLRPEGTAPVMRAIVEHKLFEQANPLKLFYLGPMFRYDRPQAGRYRQHHQFGAELIGCNKPEADVEMISLMHTTYQRLGMSNLEVQINSIGNATTRLEFSIALKNYLQSQLHLLSPESQNRFNKNPLRILDSKTPEDLALLKNAPSISNFLTKADQDHFALVCENLTLLGIPFSLNTGLVRGLDYYNRTVFEVVSKEIGAQSSIGGGGRYDGMLHSFGGPDLPAIGFGMGLERILQVLEKQNLAPPASSCADLYILPLGQKALTWSLPVANKLRLQSLKTQVDLSSKKIQQGLQTASRIRAKFCLIIGDAELDSGLGILKNLQTQQQQTVQLSSCIEELKRVMQF